MLTPGRVSVVVAVKDGARFLAEAVASVRAQSFADVELIVVDDGSTDDTLSVAGRLSIDRLISLPSNQGVSTARNIGMAVATGEFMTFLDADDRYLPDKVSRQVAYLHDHADCGCVMTDHDLTVLPGVVPPSFLENRLMPDGSAELMGLPICVMTRTRHLYTGGGFDPELRTAEDMDLIFRLQRSGRTMHRINENLVDKRIHGDNASYQIDQMNRDLLRSVRRLMQTGPTAVGAVVPVHNGAAFLEAAVASIVGQSRPVDQVVIVDDGSTDGSAELADQLAARHPGMVAVHQPHLGAGAARNHGVLATRGSHLAFLDADDLWLPDKIEQQMAGLEGDRTAALVHGLVEEFNDPTDGPVAGVPRPPYPGPLPSDLIVTRSAFAAVGPFETVPGQPEWVEWWSRAVDAGLPATDVSGVTTRRRRHSSNTTRSVDPTAYLDVVRAALERRER